MRDNTKNNINIHKSHTLKLAANSSSRKKRQSCMAKRMALASDRYRKICRQFLWTFQGPHMFTGVPCNGQENHSNEAWNLEPASSNWTEVEQSCYMLWIESVTCDETWETYLFNQIWISYEHLSHSSTFNSNSRSFCLKTLFIMQIYANKLFIFQLIRVFVEPGGFREGHSHAPPGQWYPLSTRSWWPPPACTKPSAVWPR